MGMVVDDEDKRIRVFTNVMETSQVNVSHGRGREFGKCNR